MCSIKAAIGAVKYRIFRVKYESSLFHYMPLCKFDAIQ